MDIHFAISTVKIIDKIYKEENLLYFFYFLLISYLLLNTGIFSDDFAFLSIYQKKNLTDIFSTDSLINAPLLYFVFGVGYLLSTIDNYVIVQVLKTFYIIMSFVLITKFFEIYLKKQDAFFISFIFLFFPCHDATVYMYLAQYLTLTISLYLYSYYLAEKNKLILSFIVAIIASFVSYGSPVIAFSLFVLFLLNKDIKKGLVIYIPNIIYIFYYISIATVLEIGDVSSLRRIPNVIDIYALLKQLLLQILTFADALFGPSMWLKIYYSYYQLSALSCLIGIIITLLYYIYNSKHYSGSEENTYKKQVTFSQIYNIKLVITLLVLAFTSLIMFAVTGRYPQLAFNLGNRATIFGSLLFAYLFVLLPLPRIIRTILFLVIILMILGISDHWKNWTIQQHQIIANIKNNQQLINYKGDNIIYVSGNQYSKYGRISHIEFLSEHWVVRSIFKLVGHEKFSVLSLNKRFVYENGAIIDKKYNYKDPVGDKAMVYDSEADQLLEIAVDDLNGYINKLPDDKRHWIQFIKNKHFNALILKLMPRLKYVL